MVAVRVEVCAVVPVMETEAGERLQVTGLDAFDGELLTAQVRSTVPVNESDGVTVIVEVPVEPALTVMLLLLVRLKSVLPLPSGACQKSPHPATSGNTASNSQPHFPSLIVFPHYRLLSAVSFLAYAKDRRLRERGKRAEAQNPARTR